MLLLPHRHPGTGSVGAQDSVGRETGRSDLLDLPESEPLGLLPETFHVHSVVESKKDTLPS